MNEKDNGGPGSGCYDETCAGIAAAIRTGDGPCTPKRIQRSRAKGWRMPEGAVYVGRPTKFGNPFTRENALASEYATDETWRSFVTECFADWIGPTQSGRDWWQGPQSDKARSAIISNIESLRGKDLACWCRLDQPCHADVLLKIANAPRCEEIGP